jgi:hypothetical protein
MYDVSTRLLISQCISLTQFLDKKDDRRVVGETKFETLKKGNGQRTDEKNKIRRKRHESMENKRKKRKK